MVDEHLGIGKRFWGKGRLSKGGQSRKDIWSKGKRAFLREGEEEENEKNSNRHLLISITSGGSV